jgi:hypothetical protein
MTASRSLPGDHGITIGHLQPANTVTSRATDKAGSIQPAMDDALIANKKTYWESNGQITRHILVA